MRSNRTEPWQEALRKITQCGSDYLTKNNVIPIDFSGITEDELRALGFVIGDWVKSAPLREGCIPQGWELKEIDAIHVSILDKNKNEVGIMSYKRTAWDQWSQLAIFKDKLNHEDKVNLVMNDILNNKLKK